MCKIGHVCQHRDAYSPRDQAWCWGVASQFVSHNSVEKVKRKKITAKNNEMFIYFICFGWFLFSIVVVLLILCFFLFFSSFSLVCAVSLSAKFLPCLCTNYLKWQRRIRITSSKIDTRQSDRLFDEEPHLLLPLCAAACFAAYSATGVSAQAQYSTQSECDRQKEKEEGEEVRRKCH